MYFRHVFISLFAGTLFFSVLQSSELHEELVPKQSFFTNCEVKIPEEIADMVLENAMPKNTVEGVVTLARFAAVNKLTFSLARNIWKHEWKKKELIISDYYFSGKGGCQGGINRLFYSLEKHSNSSNESQLESVKKINKEDIFSLSYKNIRTFNETRILSITPTELCSLLNNQELASRASKVQKIRVQGSPSSIQEDIDRIAIIKLTSVLKYYSHQLSLLSLESINAGDKDGWLIENILQNQTALKELSLIKYNFSHLTSISRLQKLEELNLVNTMLEKQGVQALSSLTNLKSLNLVGTKINSGDVRSLSYLTNLTSLNLTIDNIKKDDVLLLAPLTKLAFLKLGNSMGDEGLKALPLFPNLLSLDIGYNSISEKSILELLKFTTLTFLNLRHNNLSNGLHVFLVIHYLRKLNFLNLEYNKIDTQYCEKFIFFLQSVKFTDESQKPIEHVKITPWQSDIWEKYK